MKRLCKNCGAEYAYTPTANFMIFCPKCNKLDHMECEYGYGAVVPCVIYCMNKEIGRVTVDTQDPQKYRLDSEHFDIHTELNSTSVEALQEASEIIAEMIS